MRRNNWRRLSMRSQLSALTGLLHRLQTREALRRISPDALRVGVGVRKIDGPPGGNAAEARCIPTELTLVVYVKQKTPKVRATRLVPKLFVCRLAVRKRRLTLRIPTDVRTVPGVARARAAQLATNVTLSATPAAGDLALEGTLCWRFRKKGTSGPVYALTCQHVACASAEETNLAPAPGATSWGVDPGGSLAARYGQVAYRTTFGTTDDVDECLDGALIQLQPGSDPLRGAYWSFNPAGAIADQASLISEWGAKATLFSRFHPEGIAVSAPVWMVKQAISYKNQTACISTVVEYEIEGDNSSPGDSGSAIVSDSNQLLAMHIAGVDNQTTGYAIPIHLLMQPDAMGIALDLA